MFFIDKKSVFLYNLDIKIMEEKIMKKTKAKTKRISIILVMLIFIMSVSIAIHASSQITNPTFISFEDANLFNAIKACLNAKKINYNVTNTETKTLEVSIDDINEITELDLSGNEDAKITNLAGLENFVNLTDLNLSGNAITSMSTITTDVILPITKLNLAGNAINEEIQNSIQTFRNLNELNMTNMQISDISFIGNLTNLQTLVLSNNHISNFAPLNTISRLNKLDVSRNESFTDFSQLCSHTSLIELNVSGTGITSLEGITSFSELERLYASDNAKITQTLSIDPIYKTYEVQREIDGVMKKVDIAYLENLKVLNLSNIGIEKNRPRINFKKFTVLTGLTEIHLASDEIKDLSDVCELKNLNYIDLANNKIASSELEDLIKWETDSKGNKHLITEGVLKASKIDLRGNEIIDISVFASYPADIQYLDLSENHIYDIRPLEKHSFSQALYLQKQNITFGIYEKKVEVDQYIILPSIFKYSKIPETIVYDENAEFELEGVTLNPKYTEPNEYNVIIDSSKTKEDKLSIKLNGGAASGTILNFQVGSKTGAHVDCLIESIVFVDENLDAAISRDLSLQYGKKITYLDRVPHILNINQNVISLVKQFDLKHTASTEETKIRDLTGIENFLNLETLYLQDNNLVNIQPLIGCTKLQILYLANNPNIGDNNSIIQYMPKLYDLDLSNTGMTNIDSINTLINKTYVNKNKTPVMKILNISNNGLKDIKGLENITSLQKLYIANEELDDNDIQILEPLVNLITLNISGNNIENIDVLSNFTNLQYLYFNKNKVRNIEPIDDMTFYELEFSDNKVKDISPLSGHHTINNLNMNNNQIEDVSALSNILITGEQILSVTGQKITRTYEPDATGEVSIPLPQIFKAAKQVGDKLYTAYDLILTNCELDSTGDNVIINVDDLYDKISQVSIYGGKAGGTTLSIGVPLKGKITYEPSNETLTNQDVTATVSFNRTNVTITNNNGSDSYTFTENGEFTFEFVDKDGFEGTATAVVENIDKLAPQVTVSQKIEEAKIIVTIEVNEDVKDIQGWEKTVTEDEKVLLTKIFNEEETENVVIEDIAGNKTEIVINTKMDKTPPEITGVEQGKTYNNFVTPVVKDENLENVTLTKNGEIVEGYTSGTEIRENGEYVLTAIDKAGNTTKVSFTIDLVVSDVITSENVTVLEDSKRIKDIQPETTVSELKKKLSSEMEYEIVDKNGKTVSDTSNVGTGYQIKMTNGKTYTLIVKGDVTGDGIIKLNDLSRINQARLHKMGKDLDEISLIAADIVENGEIKLNDLSKINQFRLHKIKEL